MTTILTKKKDTAGAPAPGDLTNAAGGAELAVNTATKRLYSKNSGGSVIEVGTYPSSMEVVGDVIVGGNLTVTGDIIDSAFAPTLTVSGALEDGGSDGIYNAPTINDTADTNVYVYRSNPSTATGDTWTTPLNTLTGFRAEQGTFKANSVDAQIGFYANSDLTGADFNYGFYGSMGATASVAITGISGTGVTVTVETGANPHGLATGDNVFINGTSVAGYTGGPYVVTVVDSNTFTYASTATSASTGGFSTKVNNYNIYSGSAPVRFGGPALISTNSEMAGLRITQTGNGNALLVEDTTNPDTSPFVIDQLGRVIQGYTTSIATADDYNGTNRTSWGIQGNNINAALALFTTWNESPTVGAGISLSRSKSATVGTQAPVISGDSLGGIGFNGDDGTNFISAASISAAVDGTPGTDDMPGRLVFSTTADGASTPTERMRINNAGNVGIGSSSLANVSFRLQKNITGDASSYNIYNNGTVQSDVTGNAYGNTTILGTAAASFTLANMFYIQAVQGTFGAGSTVTNQYGFAVDDNLVGATNNYGFYSALPAGTNRWNFYAAGTAQNYFAGNVGIGTNAPVTKLEIAGNNTTNFSSDASSISGTTLTVGGTIAGTLAVGSAVFAAGIQPYTRITALGTGTGGAGTYTVNISQTFASAAISGSATDSGTVIRITDLDTSQAAGQPTGGLQFFTSDSSAPTAGVGAYVAAVAESNTPDTALVFGTRDNAGSGIDANERFRITSSGQLVVGYNASIGLGNTTNIQSYSTGAQSGLTAVRWSADAIAPRLQVGKSRGATIGTNTIVQSGDALGGLYFYGDDGTDLISDAASIIAAVDGTPGANDMPGRLTFNTTADGASSPTERMRIDSAGNVLVNTTTAVTTTSALGAEVPCVMVESTVGGLLALSRNDTAATSTEILGLVWFYGNDTTSNTRTLMGYFAARAGNTQGAGDNPTNLVFGVTPANSSTPYDAMMLRNDGGLGIGGTGASTVNLYLQKNITGGTTAYGMYVNANAQSDVTSTAYGIRTSLSTAAASFTLNTLIHYSASQDTVGAGSSFTNQYGFYATGTLVGATDNNIGFYSSLPAATGDYNFYAGETAASYFAGDVRTDYGFLHTTAVTNSNTSATASTSSILSGGIRTGTPAANINLTLPTGTQCDSFFTSLQTSMAAEWSVLNLAAATYSITVLAGTAHTVVGNMVVAANTAARFASKKTGTNTFVTYRIS